MTHQSIMVQDVLPPVHYSNVVVAEPGRIIFVAGQVPAGPDNIVTAVEDLYEQTLQAFRNVERCLEAAGASKEDLVNVTAFVVGYGPHNMQTVRAARGEFFGDTVTATSSVYGVTALSHADYLIEVEAVAVVSASGAL